MKKRNDAPTALKYLITIFFVFFLLPQLLAQTEDTGTELIIDTGSRLRIEGSFLVGLGIEDHQVGKTTDNDPVNISGGGGYGGTLILGYGLSSNLDLSLGFGIQNSALEPQVKNAEGSFLRNIISVTLKYKIPVTAKGFLNFGAGTGFYVPYELDLDMSKIPNGGHNIYTYESSAGFQLIAEYEGFFRENISWAAGLKYYNVSFDLESAKLDGISVPIDLLPTEVKNAVGNLNGSGVDLILSLNLYL